MIVPNETISGHEESLNSLQEGVLSFAQRVERRVKEACSQVMEGITQAFQKILHNYLIDQIEVFRTDVLKRLSEAQSKFASLNENLPEYTITKFYSDQLDQELPKLSYLMSKKVQVRIKKQTKSIAQNIFNSLGIKVLVKDNLIFYKHQERDTRLKAGKASKDQININLEQIKESKQGSISLSEIPEVQIKQIPNEISQKQEEMDKLMNDFKDEFDEKHFLKLPETKLKKEPSQIAVKIVADQAWSQDPTSMMSSIRFNLTNSWKGWYLSHDALDRWYSHPGVEWLSAAQFSENSKDWNGLPFAKFEYEAFVNTRILSVDEFLLQLRKEMESHTIRSIEIMN